MNNRFKIVLERGDVVNKKWVVRLFCFVIVCLSLHIGVSSDFSWEGLFRGDENSFQILWESRIPRTIAIILSSSALSLSGLLMQTVTQNRFAAPSTTGTVEGAQLGMLVALFFFPRATMAQKMIFAFTTAMVMTLIFLKIVRRFPVKERWLLPLMGILYGGMIGAVGEIVAYRFNLVQSLTSWRQGSFAMIQNHQYEWLFFTLILFIGIWWYTESFTLMGLGEETSTTLGLSFQKMEYIALFLVSLVTAVTIITVGSLPFLGVIVPNIVRIYQSDHLKKSSWSVVWIGVCMVLVCDIFARLIIRPYEVSVSVVLGVVGSIVFIVLLWKGRIHV